MSELGHSYGAGGVSIYALFGQEFFRVIEIMRCSKL
jgi:hypothetical protein